MLKATPSIIFRCWVVLACALASAIVPQEVRASEELVLIDAAPSEALPFDSGVDEFVPIEPELNRELAPYDEELPWSSQQARPVGRGSGERLIDRVTDPIAWLMDFRLRQQWNWPVAVTDPDRQEVEFRPTIPFLAWGQVNLLRVTVPYDLEGASGAGLGDIQIFDLLVFEPSWGRWGVGPSVRLLPDAGNDDDTFQIGPAAGAVAKNKHWTVGVLTLNYLSSDASQSRIQPILAYKFDERWSVGIGESEFRYDWKDARWTQLPLGVQVDRITDIYGQKIQFFINPQYNFQRDSSDSGWTLFLGIVLLVPDA